MSLDLFWTSRVGLGALNIVFLVHVKRKVCYVFFLVFVFIFMSEHINLKSSPLPPATLAVAGFLAVACWLWQYADWFGGLLAC